MATVAPAQHRATRTAAPRFALGVAGAIFLPVALVALIVGLASGALVPLLVAGVVLGLVLAGGIVGPAWRSAEPRALKGITAHPADEDRHARLFNLVDGLCTGAGLPRPDLRILDHPAPNAAVVGRDARRSVLVVTDGLFRKLSVIELEGVLAHELARIRDGAASVPTMALALGGPWMRWAELDPASRLPHDQGFDVEAVRMTRYPPGLAGALQRIADDPDGPLAVPEHSAGLWLAPPAGERWEVEARVDALEGL